MMTKCKVILLDYTPNPDTLVATAARTCYSPKSIEEIYKNVESDPEKNKEFIKKLMDMGHQSPLEHISFTFGIQGVSRTLTHQLVRHRIASYSQKSQRYVNEKAFEYIVPPSIKNCQNPEALEQYNNAMYSLNEIYEFLTLQCNIPKEDARYLLPNACETQIVVTMNARSLLNFFAHRCCNRAQWEIRALAYQMRKLVKEVAPLTFSHAGASCEMLGYCKEGKMSCGRFSTLEYILKNYNKMEESNHV